MTAGLNCKGLIRQINYGTDDAVGGAVITGTSLYYVSMRLQANPEEQLLLQQGLETQRTFTAVLAHGTYTIRERDELEIVEPTDHIYYGDIFRVMSVRYSSHNKRDPRNYMMLTLVRSERAHGRQ